MRKLWQRYLAGKGGVEEHDIQQLVNEVAGEDLSDILRSWIYGTDELPLAELLEHVSVKLDFRTSAGQQDKGGKAESNLPATTLGANVSEESGGLKINGLRSEGAAMQAGLSAGDIIMAVNGLRADMKSYQRWLKLSQPGSEHQLHAFRRDELMEFNVILQSPQEDTAVLSIGDENNPAMRLWLGQD
jgi:predicted metalloprotease with PDZ domain